MDFPKFDLEEMIRSIPDTTPCDSPIEEIFYYDVQKRIAIGAVIRRQVECPTRIGTFYLDFLIQTAGRRVGFECDGKEFHEADRDSKRDRAIVDASHAHRIFRLRGHDIYFHLHDALDLVRIRDESIFSERGHKNIQALASCSRPHRDDYYQRRGAFPHTAIRWYERLPDEYDDYYRYEDDERLKQPTVVCWTD